MSNGTKIAIGSVLLFLVVVGGSIGYVFSAKFTAHDYEVSVKSSFQNMENTWGQTEMLLTSSGVTVKNYGETFIKSLKANAERYQNDKGAMMKWVQEARGQMSPDLHSKLMVTLEKVYAKKEARQADKIAVSEQYQKFLGNSFKGAIASGVWSYPTEKIQIIMDKVVSTKGAKTAMETGVEEAPKLF